MGSPLSPVIANLYMEYFETQAIENSDHKPKLWLRYVDDTFIIWPHGKEKLDIFLTHLNNQHPKIQFTMETESNNQLPFLDVLVYKKPNGTLGHTIYKKKTHTNRYLHALSHHHPAQINSVAKTLISRTIRLADEQHQKIELQTLTNILTSNGYQRNKIINLIQKKSPTKIQDKEQENGIALLPYIRGTTDKISKILRKYNIKTAFCTNRKISTILRNPKDQIKLENQGVYEIPCTGCTATYIGQTNRRTSARIEEHKNSIRKEEPSSSLVQHLKATGHDIDFKNTRTIAKIEHQNNRIIREAIEIEKRQHSMNKRDDTSRLPAIWKPALIDKRISNTKKVTIPTHTKTTQDVTTTLQHKKHTQTHNNETQRKTRSQTIVATKTLTMQNTPPETQKIDSSLSNQIRAKPPTNQNKPPPIQNTDKQPPNQIIPPLAVKKERKKPDSNKTLLLEATSLQKPYKIYRSQRQIASSKLYKPTET